MSQIPAMKEFLPGMYMHHEMVNGMGYPQGLKGDEIPLMGKIVAVADTFRCDDHRPSVSESDEV